MRQHTEAADSSPQISTDCAFGEHNNRRRRSLDTVTPAVRRRAVRTCVSPSWFTRAFSYHHPKKHAAAIHFRPTPPPPPPPSHQPTTTQQRRADRKSKHYENTHTAIRSDFSKRHSPQKTNCCTPIMAVVSPTP